MTNRLTALILVACAAAAGCADITQSTSRISAPTSGGSQQVTVMSNDGEVPWFSDESEVPPEYEAEVVSVRAKVDWDGYLAKGYGSSEWRGNRGMLKLSLSVLNGTTTVAAVSSEHPQAYIIPATYIIGQPLEYAVSTTCDHIANFHVGQVAETKLGVGDYFIQLGPKSGAASAYQVQPSCPKAEDPDAPPPGEEGGSGPSDGGGGSGGGGDTGGGSGSWCQSTTYSVQRWDGEEWRHEYYETETYCYY